MNKIPVLTRIPHFGGIGILLLLRGMVNLSLRMYFESCNLQISRNIMYKRNIFSLYTHYYIHIINSQCQGILTLLQEQNVRNDNIKH